MFEPLTIAPFLWTRSRILPQPIKALAQARGLV
jgi:hypothetical protein